jgi:hypothetical protein
VPADAAKARAVAATECSLKNLLPNICEPFSIDLHTLQRSTTLEPSACATWVLIDHFFGKDSNIMKNFFGLCTYVAIYEQIVAKMNKSLSKIILISGKDNNNLVKYG